MILSFHPCIETDKNMLCAGRKPGPEDLAAIKAADAVILPQGCGEPLYEMARNNCPRVFPNYDARFRYPGKVGQIRLFREMWVPHPPAEIFLNTAEFSSRYGASLEKLPFSFPLVFKFSWGGEGDAVFRIHSVDDFTELFQRAIGFEKTGQKGFLVQEYIPSHNRTLRVVVIGRRVVSYWRIQKDTGAFCASLSAGAMIDRETDPDLQEVAVNGVKDFCSKTGINLAGFDILFPSVSSFAGTKRTPFFLEINYFFGRRGLGGSERFYALLQSEVKYWLERIGSQEQGVTSGEKSGVRSQEKTEGGPARRPAGRSA